MKKIIAKLLMGTMLLPFALIAANNFTIIPVNVVLTNINKINPNPITTSFTFMPNSDLQNVNKWQNNVSSDSAGSNVTNSVNAFTLYNYKGDSISGSVTLQLSATLNDGSAPLNISNFSLHFSANQLDPIDPGKSCSTDPSTSLVCCINTNNSGSTAEVLVQCGSGNAKTK